MPGTFIFRPIEANLTHNTDLLTKMNPYCAIVLGNYVAKGNICKKGGKHPHWNDTITLPVSGKESKVTVEIMDKDRLTHDDHIGSFTLDLNEIQSKGRVSQWYPLTHKFKSAGELLLEASFQPDASSEFSGQNYQQSYLGTEQYRLSQPGFYQREQEMTTAAYPTATLTEERLVGSAQYGVETSGLQRESALSQTSGLREGSQIYTEQRQVVEPHTFVKEVEAVEIRPVLKEIEVLEPRRVMKDVLVTEAVPVMRQVEITEPQVVKKQVEVMEPRLVTKQIQVVENVPVLKEVDVVENITLTKEVETLEPRTFTKQVEVTEQVPVMKQVQVTQPVTVKKAVEYEEDIITTKTIVKEIQQPVVVDQKITTTVGPATVVGVETEWRERQLVDKFSGVRITEEQRLLEEERLRTKQLGGYSYTTNTTSYTEPMSFGTGERRNEYSSNYYSNSNNYSDNQKRY